MSKLLSNCLHISSSRLLTHSIAIVLISDRVKEQYTFVYSNSGGIFNRRNILHYLYYKHVNLLYNVFHTYKGTVSVLLLERTPTTLM